MPGSTQNFRPNLRPDNFCPAAGLKGLLAPVQQLDRQLQQTIEVAQLLNGTAFQGYLLGSTATTQQPAEVLVAGSPLASLRSNFGLSSFEIGVVVMAIAPELDRRYERLYAHLQPNGSRKPTAQLAIDLLCRQNGEKRAALASFTANAPLIQTGLLAPLPQTEQTLQLNPVAIQYLLGQPSLDSRLSAYCQLAKPESAAPRPHSHSLLSDLIDRLHQGSIPLPLTLYFAGRGDKQQGAEALAAALNVPLLRVDLAMLLETMSGDRNTSQTTIDQKVQQIFLHGRLWGAALYLENMAVYPSLTEALLSQVSDYPGVTIFTGSAPSIPTANGDLGCITIPFTAPSAPSKQRSHWQTRLAKTHKALTETELFKLMLKRSSFRMS